jgi:large subunit ribosomal protein L4
MDINIAGSGKALAVSEVVFGREFRQDLVHQAVVAYMAGGRAGTKKQKSRSDLSGTTKKFKKQKGGGARHGDYRAPIFVGGGVTFAARPRDHSQKINRKMYRGAISSILSELIRQQRLQVVESFDVEAPKTKLLVEKLKAVGPGRTLVVTESGSDNLFRAARNIASFAVVDAAAIDPVSLIGADRVLMTVESVKKVEEWLA